MKYTGIVTAHGDAQRLVESVRLEMGNFGRSRVEVKTTPQGAIFEIEADDAIALRASLNALSQSLAVFEKMEKIL